MFFHHKERAKLKFRREATTMNGEWSFQECFQSPIKRHGKVMWRVTASLLSSLSPAGRALTLDEQYTWIRESLTNFSQPPSRTNHNVIYGPISNLFVAAKEGKVFIQGERFDNSLDSEPSASVSNGDSHRWKFYKEDIARSRGLFFTVYSSSAASSSSSSSLLKFF
ncbi:hypothetical protein J1N35_035227 [Gossypium stocksii]|uniref:Uncharacterized protein n=1 Tax=Gossypium stocksii TaxID=47602 RepID=A0A9D3UTI9_9ROSI|nr:hypothetical protein J1N35_035227 [Gossypium stocksii]